MILSFQFTYRARLELVNTFSSWIILYVTPRFPYLVFLDQWERWQKYLFDSEIQIANPVIWRNQALFFIWFSIPILFDSKIEKYLRWRTCHQRSVNGFLTCNQFMIINTCTPYFDPCDDQKNVGGKIGENGMWQCRSRRDLHWHCKGCSI